MWECIANQIRGWLRSTCYANVPCQLRSRGLRASGVLNVEGHGLIGGGQLVRPTPKEVVVVVCVFVGGGGGGRAAVEWFPCRRRSRSSGLRQPRHERHLYHASAQHNTIQGPHNPTPWLWFDTRGNAGQRERQVAGWQPMRSSTPVLRPTSPKPHPLYLSCQPRAFIGKWGT
jgi:hypothetical protein